MVSELYDALRKIGVEDTVARDAARAVLDIRTDLVTKADLLVTTAELKQEIAELKAELIKWNVGTLIAMTAIYGGLVAALKVFA
jgi:hypothetical protein